MSVSFDGRVGGISSLIGSSVLARIWKRVDPSGPPGIVSISTGDSIITLICRTVDCASWPWVSLRRVTFFSSGPTWGSSSMVAITVVDSPGYTVCRSSRALTQPQSDFTEIISTGEPEVLVAVNHASAVTSWRAAVSSADFAFHSSPVAFAKALQASAVRPATR